MGLASIYFNKLFNQTTNTIGKDDNVKRKEETDSTENTKGSNLPDRTTEINFELQEIERSLQPVIEKLENIDINIGIVNELLSKAEKGSKEEASLRTSLEQLETQKSILEAQKERMETKKTRLLEELAKLEGEDESKETEGGKIYSSELLDAIELEQRIAELEKEKSKIEAELEEINAKIEEFEAIFDNNPNDTTDLELELEDLNHIRTDLSNHLSIIEEELQEVITAITLFKEKIQNRIEKNFEVKFNE